MWVVESFMLILWFGLTGGRGGRGESDVVTVAGEDLTKSDSVVGSSYYNYDPGH